jgi:mono/diheme cytochrome c family protein
MLIAIAALAAPAGGCGSGSDDAKQDAAAAARARAQAALHAKRMTVGRRVFATNCHTCHTLDGARFTGPIIEYEAPNLDEVRLDRDYVKSRVDTGGPAMAGFGGLPPAQLASVVEYVTEAAGRNVQDDGDQPDDVLTAGKGVFAEHCAGCHAIEGRAATGNPPYPGIDFTLVKPSERYVLKKLRTGIMPEDGMMPSFKGTLSEAQMRAVATYVEAVAKEGSPAPAPR